MFDDKRVPFARRLEAQRLSSRHFAESSCRQYTRSVLRVLPHTWSSSYDTELEEATFVKHKEGKGAKKAALAGDSKPSSSAPCFLDACYLVELHHIAVFCVD